MMTVQKSGPRRNDRRIRPATKSIMRFASRTGPHGRDGGPTVPPGAKEVNLQLIHPDSCSGM